MGEGENLLCVPSLLSGIVAKLFHIRPDHYDSTKAFILLCRTMGMNSFTLAVEDEIFLEIKEQQNSHAIKH